MLHLWGCSDVPWQKVISSQCLLIKVWLFRCTLAKGYFFSMPFDKSVVVQMYLGKRLVCRQALNKGIWSCELWPRKNLALCCVWFLLPVLPLCGKFWHCCLHIFSSLLKGQHFSSMLFAVDLCCSWASHSQTLIHSVITFMILCVRFALENSLQSHIHFPNTCFMTFMCCNNHHSPFLKVNLAQRFSFNLICSGN